MRPLRSFRTAATFALALGLSGARAQTPAELEVRAGESVVFTLPRLPQLLGSENPAIATVAVLPDGRARVTGVSAGRTRLVGRDYAQVPMIFPVRVLASRN